MNNQNTKSNQTPLKVVLQAKNVSFDELLVSNTNKLYRLAHPRSTTEEMVSENTPVTCLYVILSYLQEKWRPSKIPIYLMANHQNKQSNKTLL